MMKAKRRSEGVEREVLIMPKKLDFGLLLSINIVILYGTAVFYDPCSLSPITPSFGDRDLIVITMR